MSEEVRHRNPIDAVGFARLHHMITLDTRISDGAYRLYALYLMYAQGCVECWPGGRTLAEQLNCSEVTVARYNAELVSASYITRERRVGTSSLTIIESVHDNTQLVWEADNLLAQRAQARHNRDDMTPRIKDDMTVISPAIRKGEPYKENHEGEPAAQRIVYRAAGPEDKEPLSSLSGLRTELERVPLGDDGEEIETRTSRRPKWAQPETQFQRDLLGAAGQGNARWFTRRDQKSKVIMMEKALTAAAYLSGSLLYEKCLAAAQACGEEGVPMVMPDSWFTWRYAQAREKHWSLDGLLKALLNMQSLIVHCQVKLRETEGSKHASRSGRGEARDSSGGTSASDVEAYLRNIERGTEGEEN